MDLRRSMTASSCARVHGGGVDIAVGKLASFERLIWSPAAVSALPDAPLPLPLPLPLPPSRSTFTNSAESASEEAQLLESPLLLVCRTSSISVSFAAPFPFPFESSASACNQSARNKLQSHTPRTVAVYGNVQ